MAIFTIVPDFPITETCKPRVSFARLNDYEHRTIFGLNPLVESWSLAFQSRSNAQRDALLAAFNANGFGDDGIGTASTPFEWTTPFGETGQFTCDKWSAAPQADGFTSIAADFTVAYVPGATNIAKPVAPTSAFTYCPDYAGRLEHQEQVKVVRFGDGYAHRVNFSLRSNTAEFKVEFNSRTNTDRDNIRAYLRGCAGVTAFEWTDPVREAPGKYICSEWSVTYDAFNSNTIQATFKQVFEP
jgi:phage-related protein